MNKMNRLSHNTEIRNAIYSGVGIGISGNSFLLLFHIFKYIRGQRSRHIDLPIGLLSLIHLVMLIAMSLVATDIFMPWGRWGDTTCKCVISLYRFCRSLSLCATSLLSILQAVTLNPRNSCLEKFKRKSPHYMLGCLLFLSVFYTFISSPLATYITAKSNLTSPSFTYITTSCSLAPMSYSFHLTVFILLTSRDVIFVGLMLLSSGYMVTFLGRHKKQSQFLHITSFSLKPSAEKRAMRTILCLMSFFVLMYTLDSIVSYIRSIDDGQIFYCVHIFTAHGYATVSPFLILSTEKYIINIFRSTFGRMVTIILLRNR
ncbi:vomeronasal type-1 receptor 54 [Mus musculus]|uniref:Vomeronasal type-1 receptor 54 n=1 Tax=Mus musculus TaxID=10090 RepID=V1R54_MOUSE|nr:vomeronasal type-1 receptor 54 [Mus musculus]Q9EPB8.1 RecName: Full=Vomeronasal type-1 receptor 54; AltName: Full=Pheromone receptor VN7; AltName: Full=Vomeronasal receptor 7; AltName: Full=Vomeronasal type-1 receptor A9 [Mus musculus]AAG42082.1 vomeronasal receptor V1RA9 [Mus musculus]AAG43252.1 VN7 [Mus musculus]EDK99280.1 vomeronasal 1 receptor, A9 [Mus musculus]|eukprot:NP_444454.1 vomeronasal type-1 receptor 54 [Mus musculus]